MNGRGGVGRDIVVLGRGSAAHGKFEDGGGTGDMANGGEGRVDGVGEEIAEEEQPA